MHRWIHAVALLVPTLALAAPTLAPAPNRTPPRLAHRSAVVRGATDPRPSRGPARRAKARVTFRDNALEEINHEPGYLGYIDVARGTQPLQGYWVTNRGLDELAAASPPGFFDLAELRGKRVLDAGTGGGQFVEDLRKRGMDAFGVDLVLPNGSGGGRLLRADVSSRADMTRVARTKGPFDVIYSTMNIFYYPSEPIATRRAALANFARMLVPGGVIRLVGVRNELRAETLALVREHPDLELVRDDDEPHGPLDLRTHNAFIEIRRKPSPAHTVIVR